MSRAPLRPVALLAAVVLAGAASLLRAQAPGSRTLELTGMVLVNGFFNDNSVNNADVPQFVVPDAAARRGGLGGTARQSRLGVFLMQPGVLGGTFQGEVDVDFFGGQLGNAGRTFPLVRMRRFVARVHWRRAELLVGQEAPLAMEFNPRSLASVGVPGFVAAGNLWFWMPQVRGTYEVGSAVRLAFQGAVIAPMTGDTLGTFSTRPDAAERSDRPFLQGRIRVSWGTGDDPSELGVAVHRGWIADSDSTLVTSRAVVVSGRVRLGVAEVRGEWYSGQALAALGGGGIGRNFSPVTGAPLDDTAGWLQLNLRPTLVWDIGAGIGIDEPDGDQLDGADPAQRLRNLVWEAHAIWQPAGPIVVGAELRRIETEYGGGRGTLANTHVNVQAGFRF